MISAAPAISGAAPAFREQTLRLIVHASIGGGRLCIRLSNQYGVTALTIGQAHLALRQAGADIAPGSSRALTFNGLASITIPAGARMLSDPVALAVPAQARWR